MFLWVFWLFDAALIGIIVAVVNRGEFPGWGPMLACVAAITITSNLVSRALPWPASLLGIGAGAAVGAFVIAWTCDLSYGQAAKAAGVYLAIRIPIGLGLFAMMS